MTILELSKRMKELSGKVAKGPWHSDLDWREGGADQVLDANDQTVCFMAHSSVDEDADEGDAANLIAASRTAIDQFVRFVEKVQSVERRLCKAGQFAPAHSNPALQTKSEAQGECAELLAALLSEEIENG